MLEKILFFFFLAVQEHNIWSQIPQMLVPILEPSGELSCLRFLVHVCMHTTVPALRTAMSELQ